MPEPKSSSVPSTPRWAWSFLAIVAVAMLATIAIHLGRLPTGARGYYNRAVVDTREGRYDSAIENLDRAQALDPKWATVRVARANAWYRAGHPYRALADANAALALEPTSRGYFIQGSILRQLGREDQALASFALACDADHAYGKAHLARGDLLLDAGRFQDALAAYRNAASTRGSDDSMYVAPLLIWAARALGGDIPGAAAELGERVRATPADRARLAPWAAAAATAPGTPVVLDDRSVAAWIDGIKRLASADRPAAIGSLRRSASAGPPEHWAADRARYLLRAVTLGFTVQPDDTEISSSFSFGPGLTVAWVGGAGGAAASGLAVNDRLVAIGGQDATVEAVDEAVYRAPPGSTLTLEVERQGARTTLTQVVGGPAAVRPGASSPTK